MPPTRYSDDDDDADDGDDGDDAETIDDDSNESSDDGDDASSQSMTTSKAGVASSSSRMPQLHRGTPSTQCAAARWTCDAKGVLVVRTTAACHGV